MVYMRQFSNALGVVAIILGKSSIISEGIHIDVASGNKIFSIFYCNQNSHYSTNVLHLMKDRI